MPRPSSRSRAKPKKKANPKPKPSSQEKPKVKPDKPVKPDQPPKKPTDKPSQVIQPDTKITKEQREEFWRNPEEQKKGMLIVEPRLFDKPDPRFMKEEISPESEKGKTSDSETLSPEGEEENKSSPEAPSESPSSKPLVDLENPNSSLQSLRKEIQKHKEKPPTLPQEETEVISGGLAIPSKTKPSNPDHHIKQKIPPQTKEHTSPSSIEKPHMDTSSEYIGEIFQNAVSLYKIPSYELIYVEKVSEAPQTSPPPFLICFNQQQATQIQSHFNQSVKFTYLIDILQRKTSLASHDLDEIHSQLIKKSIHQSKVIDLYHYISEG